ncbi:hypothetical protein [Thermococcus piezophilus]|uniref:hypothetical protein n=1 Tax=Thermococcus piezophilus TaxID=1712654 RepID=UPI0018FF290A|nr:hypothetical protein [Thermococcus piezophilus]
MKMASRTNGVTSTIATTLAAFSPEGGFLRCLPVEPRNYTYCQYNSPSQPYQYLAVRFHGLKHRPLAKQVSSNKQRYHENRSLQAFRGDQKIECGKIYQGEKHASQEGWHYQGYLSFTFSTT